MESDKNDYQNLLTELNPNKEENLQKLFTQCLSDLKAKPEKYQKEEYSVYIKEIPRFYNLSKDDIKTAFAKWEKWGHWYSKFHPDTITEADIPNEKKKGMLFVHGSDREGRPCLMFKFSYHKPEESEYDELVKSVIYYVNLALSKCKNNEKNEICIIMDRIGMGWCNVDKRMLTLPDLMGVCQEYFAEKIYKIYCYPINWLFHILIKMSRPFMSKETYQKLIPVNKKDDLQKYFTPENLIKELGGTSEYKMVNEK